MDDSDIYDIEQHWFDIRYMDKPNSEFNEMMDRFRHTFFDYEATVNSTDPLYRFRWSIYWNAYKIWMLKFGSLLAIED